MAEGHLDTRVGVQGNDEIDRLAISFNTMAARLEDANRLQIEAENARRQMIAAISHDLRTPLSSIQAMVEAIQDDVVDGETAKFYLTQILDEARGLTDLINDLFELSRIDAGALRLQIEANQASMLIRDALDTMQPKAIKRDITSNQHAAATASAFSPIRRKSNASSSIWSITPCDIPRLEAK